VLEQEAGPSLIGATLQVELIRLGDSGGGRRDGSSFGTGEGRADRCDDALDDVALYRERVVHGPVVPLRPEMALGGRIEQPHRDPEPVADHLYAGFDDAAHRQLLTDLPQRLRGRRVVVD
jgi:hypothetical protein